MRFEKILIPLSGDEADEEAIGLACNLGKQFNSQIYTVYVVIIPLTFPIDTELKSETEKAEKVIEHVRNLAEEQSCRTQGVILKTRATGPPIIDIAREYDIDLILLSIKYMKRFGQFSLGSTVPYILKNANCKVILYRQYKP